MDNEAKKTVSYIKTCNLLIFFALLIQITLGIWGIATFPTKVNMIEGTTISLRTPIDTKVDSEVITVSRSTTTSFLKEVNTSSIDLTANEVGTGSIILNAFGIPVKTAELNVIPEIELIPCGLTVGVTIDMEGVMVLGDGYINTADGKTVKPSDDKLKSGDVILEVNAENVSDKNHLMELIEKAADEYQKSQEEEFEINFLIERLGQEFEVSVNPAMSVTDGKYKIGCWVRDSTKGIGTITYVDPATGVFAALGHGILDVDTKKLMNVQTGKVTKSNIVSVKQGKKGSPGELIGQTDGEYLGEITNNTNIGIYGDLANKNDPIFSGEPMKIAMKDEMTKGYATILANIEGTTVEEFDIEIESVNLHNADNTKGIVIKITDERLISVANGIVQGMSGSPILQNGKIVGAVTHVFVNEPTRGYGIFIENMLQDLE